jgi:2-keto-4-pentenoate hydratase/2-oxohepta-3-ene-1,7-dioic acid hydratase in catechol pathway
LAGTNIDWECELGVVLSRTADHVPPDRAGDYIFGYTARKRRVRIAAVGGDTRHGSDWVLQKNHDTFAPMGPFIVPKEFVREPAEPAGEVHARTARSCRTRIRP